MHITRFAILFGVVLFGAFAQHKAAIEVPINQSNQKRTMTLKETVKSDDLIYMERAIAHSKIALKDGQGNPFGSVIVKDGKIVGEGWNKTELLKDPSAHAEVEAIRDACRNMSSTKLKGSVIYSIAQPCSMCLSLIYRTGIEKVYYCIPGKRINEFNASLSVDNIYDAVRVPEFERRIREIPIMENRIESIMDYYQQQTEAVSSKQQAIDSVSK